MTDPLRIELLADRLAICRLAADAAPPEEWDEGGFVSLTRTADELSLVCRESLVTRELRAEAGWRLLKLIGPFDFDAVGVLAPIAGVLAAAGISMLPIATFDTDYLLIKQERLAAALALLRAQGHRVDGAE